MKAQWTIATNLQRILNTYAVEWGLTVSKVEIRLVNEAAEEYFVGNAQLLKRMEMTENSLRENVRIVITENGISPPLLLGSLPVTVSSEEQRQSPPMRFKNWRSLAPQKMSLNIEKG
jgi:hypothetical protein